MKFVISEMKFSTLTSLRDAIAAGMTSQEQFGLDTYYEPADFVKCISRS